MNEILMERFVEHAKSKWVEKAAKKKCLEQYIIGKLEDKLNKEWKIRKILKLVI